jgi:uncharacterized membrane protein
MTMIKKNLKLLIVTSIVILLPVLAGVALWDQLPDPMPSHWNAAGGKTFFGRTFICCGNAV